MCHDTHLQVDIGLECPKLAVSELEATVRGIHGGTGEQSPTKSGHVESNMIKAVCHITEVNCVLLSEVPPAVLEACPAVEHLKGAVATQETSPVVVLGAIHNLNAGVVEFGGFVVGQSI